MFKRINLYGGAGAGKSTTADELSSKLKRAGCKIEHIHEYVKDWPYADRKVHAHDQHYIQAKQLRREVIPLTGGRQAILTDSPIELSMFYANKYTGCWYQDAILSVCAEHEKRYPAISIFIDRGDKPYDQGGRYQTEAQARADDRELHDFLHDHHIEHEHLAFDDMDHLHRLADELIYQLKADA